MSKNAETLASFTAYCQQHPEARFWQALLNWSGNTGWLVFTPRLRDEHLDTFYFEGKDK